MTDVAAPQPSKRDLLAQERREAVLEAALQEFIERGFAATRIEDVAGRAGVAKGTIYLYFKDKEALFAESIRREMDPVAMAMAALLEDERAAPRAAVEAMLTALVGRLLTSRTGDVVRLIMSETIRLPALTAFYREEIVLPMLGRMAALLKRARAAGDLRNPETADYPHLVVAPVILMVLARRLGVGPVFGAPDDQIRVHLANIFV